MIDLHCHYLPGVDDGAPDLAAGLALARAAAANGVRTAVLTPHVYPGRWDNTRDSLTPVFERFGRAVEAAGIPLALRLGAELHLHPDALALFEAGQVPTLGSWLGRRVVLLELPDGGIPVGADKAIERLHRHDAVAMIAHPERNRAVMRSTTALVPLVEAGCLLQLTAASVCGLFGAPAHRAAHAILEAGWATVVATDAHNLAHRPPLLAQARHVLREQYGAEVARRLTETTPSRILADPPARRLDDGRDPQHR